MKVTGSLTDRRGIFQMVVRVYSEDGAATQRAKSTQIRVTGKNQKQTHSNRLAAEKMLAAWISELEESGGFGRKRQLIPALEDWLKKKARSVRTDTSEAYQIYFDNHLKPYFAPKKLAISDVTPRVIQNYVDQMEEKGLSPNSIEKHLVLLNGVFKEAVRLQEIRTNPCASVVLSRKKKFKGRAYDAQTARRLLSAIKGDQIETPVYLGLYLGLRRSEVAGLRWKDIDFEHNTVRIRNTVVRLRTLQEQEETKSDASNRTLYLPSGLKTYLECQKREISARMALFGTGFGDGTHVCQWPDGRQYAPDYITRRFKSVLKANGLPEIRFHDLRHTAGSLLINEGHSPKQVQEFLGHEKVSTTLDIYTHLSIEGKANTASCMDSLLTGINSPEADAHGTETA